MGRLGKHRQIDRSVDRQTNSQTNRRRNKQTNFSRLSVFQQIALSSMHRSHASLSSRFLFWKLPPPPAGVLQVTIEMNNHSAPANDNNQPIIKQHGFVQEWAQVGATGTAAEQGLHEQQEVREISFCSWPAGFMKQFLELLQ